MVWAPSSTSIEYGLGWRVTSAAFTQPVLPLGRTGSSTCTQPSERCCLTRNTCGTFEVGTSGSYSHGLSNVRALPLSEGASNTSTLVTAGLTVAMYERF